MCVILRMLFFHLRIAFVKWSSWKWLENTYTMFICIHVPTHDIGRNHPVVKNQEAPSRFNKEATMKDVSEYHHFKALPSENAFPMVLPSSM